MQTILIILFISLLGVGSPEKPSAEKAWPAELNTAKDAAYMNELEQNVILELNKVRSNPKRYAEEYMEELRADYKGKLFYVPGQEIPVRTDEGIRPLEECIRVLKRLIHVPCSNLPKDCQKRQKN